MGSKFRKRYRLKSEYIDYGCLKGLIKKGGR